ncbi:MAG: hypothetical protein WKG07_11985 [Hymenobacter sp.]
MLTLHADRYTRGRRHPDSDRRAAPRRRARRLTSPRPTPSASGSRRSATPAATTTTGC